MKLALVDDEQIDDLFEIFTKVFSELGIHLDQVDTFRNGEEFLNAWRVGAYDMIVLDIFMDKLSGVDIARKIREMDLHVKIVFCTTSNDFASESYSVNACYYLHKPIDRSDIQTMVEKINLTNYDLTHFVTLPDGQRVILRNILYTEYNNHVVHIHIKNGDDIESRMLQSDLEKLLDKLFLISCSQGIIINLYEVEKLQNGICYMRNGVTLPISRRKAKELEKIYTEFLFYKTRKEMIR